MVSRISAAAVGFAVSTLCWTLTAHAQAAPPSDSSPSAKSLPAPPAVLPQIRADRTRGLDFLLGALKVAPDDEIARSIEARIWALWSQTTSDTTALLMARVKAATDAKQISVAIKLLDSIVALRPDYIEGWNRRATLMYMQDRYDDALQDLRQVLQREPRHFGALVGLGMIMQELGEDKRALEAYRKALAINPRIEKIPELVEKLTETVEGRDI